MTPQLIESAAKAQVEDRLRAAECRRLAARARAGAPRPVPAARPGGRRLGLRSLRSVFG